LKLKHDDLQSAFAFNFNLRRYGKGKFFIIKRPVPFDETVNPVLKGMIKAGTFNLSSTQLPLTLSHDPLST
jgi:hypothetical protein